MVPTHSPVAIPHSLRSFADPGNFWPAASQALRMIKLSAVQVAERSVRKVQVSDVPGVVLVGIATRGLAKKRELEAKTMSVFRGHVPRVIPPFGLVSGMVEVVAGKFVEETTLRGFVGCLCAQNFRAECCGKQHEQEAHPRQQSTHGAGPRADRARPPLQQGKTRQPPWLHTRSSARRAAPPPASESEWSIRTIVC